MPTIHMDVEQVKAVLERMRRDEGFLQESLKNVKGEMDAIHGKEWIGNAMEEMAQGYDSLDSRLSTQLMTLDILASRLEMEIAEWETAAAKLP